MFVIGDGNSSLFAGSGLRDFDALWSWQGTMVDDPNRRANGVSTVSVHHLVDANGRDHVFYLKKQQDYFPRSLLAPRRLLLCREYRAIALFAGQGVATLEVAAMATRMYGRHRQGVLATVALTEHVALDELLERHGNALPDTVMNEIAVFLRHMHARRLFHGNLYSKHLFVHAALVGGETTPDPVRIIDLEDARRLPFPRYAVVRDLEKLNRHCLQLSAFRRLRFFLRYLDVRRLTRAQRRLLGAVVARGRRRRASTRW
jgi:hypothetical protein